MKLLTLNEGNIRVLDSYTVVMGCILDALKGIRNLSNRPIMLKDKKNKLAPLVREKNSSWCQRLSFFGRSQVALN